LREDVVYLLAEAAIVLFGSAAAFHPSVRDFSWPARFAAALAAGSVLLTVEATLFSMLGIAWSVGTLAVPLLLVSALLLFVWIRKVAGVEPERPLPTYRSMALVLSSLGFLYLLLSLALSASTSVDYLLFWGVKAVRFAEARGIDAAFLRSGYSYHAVPDYPPLVPILQAWGALASGKMPWRLNPILSAVWAIAAAALLVPLLRRKLGAPAWVVLALWSVALSFSLAYSYSGGNAEAPLLFFETIAIASLLTESETDPSRFLAGIALCGAVLTKVEGTAAALALIAGTFARDLTLKRRRAISGALRLTIGPALGLVVWFSYQTSAGLQVGYRPHGELLRLYPSHWSSIAKNMLYFLNAGTLWLSWTVPLLFLAWFVNRWRLVLPALALALGLMGFLVFDYLHDKDDPAVRIGWTLPRASQPALSALVLGAGVAVFARSKESAVS
jgi:hypothetical protein